MAVVNIDEDDGDYVVIAPYDEDFKEEAKRDYHAKWDPDLKAWRFSGEEWTLKQVEGLLKLHFPRAFS